MQARVVKKEDVAKMVSGRGWSRDREAESIFHGAECFAHSDGRLLVVDDSVEPTLFLERAAVLADLEEEMRSSHPLHRVFLGSEDFGSKLDDYHRSLEFRVGMEMPATFQGMEERNDVILRLEAVEPEIFTELAAYFGKVLVHELGGLVTIRATEDGVLEPVLVTTEGRRVRYALFMPKELDQTGRFLYARLYLESQI